MACSQADCRDVSCPTHGTRATYPEAVKPVDAFLNEIGLRNRANAARRAKDQAMRDMGMKKVRGALGGTYWE